MEIFEGKRFVGWIAKKLSEDNYLKIMLTDQDFKFVGSIFGELLLKSGILKVDSSTVTSSSELEPNSGMQ